MRRIASAASLVALVVVAACSRNVAAESEPAPALEPVGAYDFSVSTAGITRTGELHVQRGTDGTLGGFGTLEGAPGEAPITAIAVDGDHMTIEVTPPNGGGAVVFDLNFTGATFTGTIAAEGQTFPVTGAKRAS